MAKSQVSQVNFNAGVLGPYMFARADFARYASGLRRMENFVPTLQGPAVKRPGFRFASEIGASASEARLSRAIFSQTDSYILEWGNQTLRFYTDRGVVVEAAKTITALTSASPGVFTSNAHGFLNGQRIRIAGLVGPTALNGRDFTVRNQTTNTFTLEDMWGAAVNTTSLPAYVSGGTASRHYSIATPYTLSDLVGSDGAFRLSMVQSADTFYVCVPGYQTRKLTRSAPTSWSLTAFEPTGGPFKTVDADTTITVYASAQTGTGITLTASSGIFQASHVGSLFLLEQKLTDANPAWEVGKAITSGAVVRSQGHWYKALNSATTGSITPSHTEGARFDGQSGVQWEYQHSGYGWVRITAFTSATQVSADVVSLIPDQAVGSGNASTRWAFAAWSAVDGWPTHVAFYRERLAFFRGTEAWFSVPLDFENYAERDAGIIANDSAFRLDFRSGQNDAIQWVSVGPDLLIGTEGGEFAIAETSNATGFGPDNRAALKGPGYGSRRVEPINLNDAVLYVQNSGRIVRELRFAFETDGYVSLDRTILAHDIADGRVVRLAWAPEPFSVAWAVTRAGELLGYTYNREQDVYGWHTHPIGGSGFVEDVQCIPSPDGAYWETYVIVRRTINGQTKRYLEYMAEAWSEKRHEAKDMHYVDSGLTYAGSAVSTLSGLEHLEGQSVRVFADAVDRGAFTVTGGSVTLPVSVTTAQAGLPYTATLQSLPYSMPGMVHRIVRGFVRLWASIGLKFGAASATRDEVDFRSAGIPVTTAIPPFFGVKEAPGFPGGFGRDESWLLEHDYPTALTVTGVYWEAERNAER